MIGHYVWSAARQWGQRLGTALTFVILARILPADQIGLVSAALAIMALAELVSENGTAEAVIRHRDASGGAAKALNFINMALSLVMASALVMGAGRIEAFFGTPGLAPVVRVLSVVLLLNAFVYVPTGLLRRDMQFRTLARIGLTATVVGSAIGIGGAFAGWGLWALVGQAVGFALVNAVLVIANKGERWTRRPDFCAARPLLRFGGFVMLGNVLTYAATRSVELALPYHYGAAVLAAYVIGSRFYFVAAQMVSAVLLDVGMSRLSARQDDAHGFAGSLLLSVEAGMLIAAAIFGGLAAIAPEFCDLVFGEKGALAWPYLQIMGVAGAPLLLNYMAQIALKARNRAGFAVIATAIQAMAATIILLPAWPISPLTRVIALNAAAALPLVLQWAMLSRDLALPVARIARRIFPAWFAGAAMVLAVALVRGHVPPQWPLMVNMAVLIGVGAAVFVALAALLTTPDLKDCLSQQIAPKAAVQA